MLLFTIVIIILMLLGFMYLIWRQNENTLNDFQEKQYQVTDEFKKTLAFGIYQRFCTENEPIIRSKTFIKNTPLEFENFIANILKHKYGEHTYITKNTGDFGVDIEHGFGEDKVLGQVKCYKEDLSFEPIAILHSNMVKENVSKGYVVTTSDFSTYAKEYAEKLNIDLITGTDLVELWLHYADPVYDLLQDKKTGNVTRRIDAPI
ncbi:restriction endonuclease [Oceanobacillus kimchii]|uniref:restriction endonuclease n=1 Tax=Oceanobacillus kimchii TaxID=746691 RepID=UPI00034A59ED|nr:restriction endonuclease [Oceanobacillus kimchii]